MSVVIRIINLFNFQRRNYYARYGQLRQKFFKELWPKTAADIGASIKELGNGFYQVEKEGKSTFVKQSGLNLDPSVSLLLADDKAVGHHLLTPLIEGYKPPPFIEFNLNNLGSVLHFLRAKSNPIVIKPASGTGAGMGITTGITTKSQLFWALVKAKAYSSEFLAEEQVSKNSYRLLFFNKKLIHVVRRDPPVIIGDGNHSILRLVELENEKRLKGNPITSLNPLEIDLEAKLYLESQNLYPGSVPAKGERIILKRVVNQNSATENHIEQGAPHPSIIKLGEQIADILQIKLFGLDLLATNLQQDLKESGAITTDINAGPGLHHHYLVANPDPDYSVAAILLQGTLDNVDRK